MFIKCHITQLGAENARRGVKQLWTATNSKTEKKKQSKHGTGGRKMANEKTA